MHPAIAILLIATSLAAGDSVSGKRGLTAEDYYAIQTGGDPQIRRTRS